MKPTIKLDEQTKESLLKTTIALIEKISKEIHMLKKSITEVPNADLANETSYHFASTPLLLRLSLSDLCVLFKLYLESNYESEKNTLVRLICGQLYEFTEDVQEILGKKYRELLKNFPNSEELTGILNNEVIKEFHRIKSNHIEFLKIIRHNVSHHKDIDALWQYYLINEIDFNWGIKAYIDFTQWYLIYNSFEQKLIEIAMQQQYKNR